MGSIHPIHPTTTEMSFFSQLPHSMIPNGVRREHNGCHNGVLLEILCLMGYVTFVGLGKFSIHFNGRVELQDNPGAIQGVMRHNRFTFFRYVQL